MTLTSKQLIIEQGPNSLLVLTTETQKNAVVSCYLEPLQGRGSWVGFSIWRPVDEEIRFHPIAWAQLIAW